MSEPLRKAYSKQEMEALAKTLMLETYGKPRELDEEARNRWMEKFGLLCHFIAENFPE